MNNFGSIIVWSLILVGFIAGAFVLAAMVRRKYFKPEDYPRIGFTMAELRQLHESGKMSREEFEKAKAAMIGEQRKGPQTTDRDHK